MQSAVVVSVLVAVNKHSGKVAEVFQASTADRAVIDRSTSTGGAHQIWQLATP